MGSNTLKKKNKLLIKFMQIVESLELNNIVAGVYMLVMWMSGRMHDVCVPAVCVHIFWDVCVFWWSLYQMLC